MSGKIINMYAMNLAKETENHAIGIKVQILECDHLLFVISKISANALIENENEIVRVCEEIKKLCLKFDGELPKSGLIDILLKKTREKSKNNQ